MIVQGRIGAWEYAAACAGLIYGYFRGATNTGSSVFWIIY